MDKETLMWLLGGLASWCIALSIVVLKLLLSVNRIETAFVLISKRAADILHRDDDKYRLDYLLEKYKARMHELSFAEWKELLSKCEAISQDKSISKDERLAAGLIKDLSLFVKELAIHKTMFKPRS
jgi:hypothetical protein